MKNTNNHENIFQPHTTKMYLIRFLLNIVTMFIKHDLAFGCTNSNELCYKKVQSEPPLQKKIIGWKIKQMLYTMM